MSTESEALPSRRRSPQVNNLLIAVLLGLVAVLLYRQMAPLAGPLFDSGAETRAVAPRGDLAADERTTIELFKQTKPSVVHITTTGLRQDVLTRNIFQIPAGSGSGFVWDQGGHVVTNLHVVREAQHASVTLSDNSSYGARMVGFDADHDIAVLKIEAPASKLKAIVVGTSQDLQVGQKVFAIGSPFEFDMTLTTGIISGLDRTIDTGLSRIHGAVQTDAAINPGNSGGPLLDSAGRLVGINTAIFSESGGSHGIGFAVPVDLVNLVVPELIRNGTIDRPWLGVVVAENVSFGGAPLPGVVVKFVMPDSPAGRAGLKPLQIAADGVSGWQGDRILSINGQPISSRRDLLSRLSQHRPGDTIKIKVMRGSEEVELSVLLEAHPGGGQ